MKLGLEIRFRTDGDFIFDEPESIINPESGLYEGAHIKYEYSIDSEKFYYLLIATGEDLPCRYAARDLLENLICNFRTSPTHVFLVKDIYEFLNGPIENDVLFDRTKDIDYDDYLSGNYDGTNLRLIIRREENEPPRPRTQIEIENEYKEIIKDSTIVDGAFANQERRNELLEEYRGTLSEEAQLAIWLHANLCHYNHTDGCSWSYEIDGVRDNWEGYAHKEYLSMAKRMMDQCSSIDLIKDIIGSIKEKKDDSSN